MPNKQFSHRTKHTRSNPHRDGTNTRNIRADGPLPRTSKNMLSQVQPTSLPAALVAASAGHASGLDGPALGAGRAGLTYCRRLAAA